MAAPVGNSASYGGVGGAFRRRRHRSHQATPYDRPPTAFRNPQRSSDGGWLSKIVDPASKLFTAGAHMLFSSVFRKRLLPLPQKSTDETWEPRDNGQEAVTAEDHSGAREGAVSGSRLQNTNSQANGVTELEHILKQKTFTRPQIDRLMALLHSRTSDTTAIAGEERIELKSHDSLAGLAREGELADGAFEKNRVNSSVLPGTITAPAMRSKVNEDAIASPAELAKAYMGNQPTKVSPLVLGRRSQAHRDEVPEFNTTFQLRASSVNQMQKPLITYGISENNVIAPRSRGRSAIYSMARTPYSRAQPAGALKGFGSRVDAFDGLSLPSSQKVLKRRHSVLENDIGSVGPIRRTRQKSNLMHPKSLGVPSSNTLLLTQEIPSDAGGASPSFMQSPCGYTSLKAQADKGEKSVPVSGSHVSYKSIEMGERILQQLEKLTPPKEEPSDRKPGASGGSSSMEMTPAMLHGQARRSIEPVNSLRFLENVQDIRKEVNSVDPVVREVRTSVLKMKDKVDGESSSKTLVISSKLENDEAKLSSKGPPEIAKTTGSVVSKSAAVAPKKGRAFQMSAHEDCLDLDDDVHSNGFESSSMNGGKELLGKSAVQSMATEVPENPLVLETNKMSNTPMFSELKPSDSLLNKNACLEQPSLIPALAEKSIDSGSPAAPGSSPVLSTAAEPVIAPQTTSGSDKAAFTSPAVSFGIKGSDKVSPVSFSTSSSVLETSVSTDAKPHSSSSVVSFSSTAMDTMKNVPGSDNESTGVVSTYKISKSIPPSSVSGPSTSISSFVASAMNSTATNGFFSSSTGMSSSASSPALFSNQSSSSSFGQPTFTAATVTTTAAMVTTASTAGDSVKAPTTTATGSAGSLTSSAAFPSFSSAPTFKDGSSSRASTSEFVVSFTAMTDSASKSKEFAFGNNPVSLASSATDAGSRSTSFQFGASTSTPISSTQLQGSYHDISSKPTFSNLSTTTFATSTHSAPSQPSSLTVLPASTGLSGSTNLVSGNVPFGSSISAVSSGLAFGSSLSSSLSMTESGSTKSGPASIFGSSWQAPDAATAFSSSFNSSASSGFAFGVSPSTSSPAVNAPSGFTFGVSSSASAPATSPASGFSFGVLSSSSTSAQTSNTLSGFSFGLSTASAPANSIQAPVFGFGAPSTSAPSSTISSSSPFQFGASSGSAPTSCSMSMFDSASSSPTLVFSVGATPASSITSQPTPQPMFGNGSVFPFGSLSAPSGNSNQMSMEDTMAEDSTPLPAAPVFGQPPNAQQQPSSGFVFGTPPQPMAGNPFQFGGQQSQVGAPQKSSPFQPAAGGSFELGAGGSFSLGTGGNDRSTRKIVKVKSKLRKR